MKLINSIYINKIAESNSGQIGQIWLFCATINRWDNVNNVSQQWITIMLNCWKIKYNCYKIYSNLTRKILYMWKLDYNNLWAYDKDEFEIIFYPLKKLSLWSFLIWKMYYSCSL